QPPTCTGSPSLHDALPICSDNPRLNVREVDTARQPIRAVVDARFEIDEGARMFDGGKVWLFVCRIDQAKAERLAKRNVEVVVMRSEEHTSELQSREKLVCR